MKNLKIALLMLVAVVFIMPSCKKGENDPFLSLKSRKGRICGEWTLKEGTLTSTNGGQTATMTFNGTTCTYTQSGQSQTVAYIEKITIEKDGTFEYVITEGTDITTYKGGWYFGRKNKELEIKNKETLCLAYNSAVEVSNGTTSTYSYTGTSAIDGPMVIQIDMLKGKEMTILIDGSSTYPNGSSTHKGTLTYEQ